MAGVGASVKFSRCAIARYLAFDLVRGGPTALRHRPSSLVAEPSSKLQTFIGTFVVRSAD
jgi:hypothetical protein